MGMIDSLIDRIDGLFDTETGRHDLNARLFYRVELVAETDATRDEYCDRAEELRQEINDTLMDSGRFTNLWVTRTRDPFIVLDEQIDGTNLTWGDENVRDATDKSPWPDDIAVDTDDLRQSNGSVEEAQQSVRNVIIFEILAGGSSDTSEGDFGAPAPMEGVRELIRQFEDHEHVSSFERLYSLPDERTYGFVSQTYEVRLKAIIENGWPHIEWSIGPPGDQGRGIGWVGVVGDEEYGLSNGRLYFDERRNGRADEYIDPNLDSMPMPEPIAEKLLADIRRLQEEAAVDRQTPDLPVENDTETGSIPDEHPV